MKYITLGVGGIIQNNEQGGRGQHIVAFIKMFLYFNNFTKLPPEDLLPHIAYFHLLLLPFLYTM